MLFNSPEFLLFLPIVFGLYWFVVQRNLKAQNMLLVIASYVFYGWWDWRFLGLIAFSTLVDYLVGLQIEGAQEKRAKKAWLGVSLLVNLGLLCYFKYSNFFIDSWVDAWASAGVTMHVSSLKVILPVGISFYTFQTLSYSIDIYRGNLKPTRSFINFAAFVSFFPQLVAGPIERASRLLPQIENKRVFKYEEGVAGLRLILWGMFKKVVVADTCAIYANDIFANYTEYSGPTLMLGAVYFAFQIYGDFSGLQRHRHRHRQALWHPAHDQLQDAVLLPRHRGVLAALAHLAFDVVPRLPLHSARRFARGEMEIRPQRVHHLPGERILARRQLDLHCLGRHSRHAFPAACCCAGKTAATPPTPSAKEGGCPLGGNSWGWRGRLRWSASRGCFLGRRVWETLASTSLLSRKRV